MRNEKLIERLGDYINNTEDCALRKEAADALALADKRIAELQSQLYEADGIIADKQHNLAVAARALDAIKEAGIRYQETPFNAYMRLRHVAAEALTQIGGGDAG